MKRTAHRLTVGVLTIILHAATWGQTIAPQYPGSILPSHGYVHTRWGPDEGLPSADTGPIIQDRTGYLWIGTGFGVVRFDGVSFTTFTSKNTPAFRGQQVLTIHEDRRGRVWVGVHSGGLAIYDHGRFVTPSFMDSLLFESVTGIFADSAGNTYLCTPRGPFVIKDDKAKPVTGLPGIPRSGLTWPDGTVYFTHLSLMRYDPESGRSTTVIPADGETFDIADVLPVTNGRFYTARLGVINRYALQPDGTASLEASFPSPGALRIAKDGDGGYFVGTIGYGVIKFDGERYSRPQGLGVQRGAGRQVHALLRSTEGDLLATTSGGLYRFSRTFFSILGVNDGLTHDYSWLVHLQQRGTLWIGAGVEGTYRHDGSRFTLLKKKDGMPDDHVTDLFESADGRMWFGGANGAVSVYSNGSFRQVMGAGSGPGGRVQSISEDHEHRIWIGTRTGLYILSGNRLTQFRLADGSTVPAVRNVVHMPDGTFWCVASGLVARIRDGILRSYMSTPDRGFYGTTAMLVDTGRVWFGTYGGGLYLIAGDSVINLNRVCPGVGPRILAIHEDRLGYLWINAERELQRVRKSDLLDAARDSSRSATIDVFDHNDGLRDLEFNMASANSSQVLPDGRILYASTSGIVAVRPAAVSRPTSPPPVVIERVIADDIVYDAVGEAVLPAGTNRIQIEFTALRFQSPGRVTFRYRLIGVDRDWIYAGGNEHTATYTNVGPGDLRFVLAASVNGGRWSDHPVSKQISIAPFFYEQPWIQVAFGLVLIGTAVGAFRWRTRRVRRRNRQLEEEVQRRVEAETRIQSSLDEKTVMLKEIHHRVKNNMQIISSLFSLQLGSSRDPLVQEMLRESQTRIRSMALVHETLYRSNNLAAIDFREYVQGLAAQIAQAHHRKDVHLRYLGESITLTLDQAIPAGLIMNEALSNAYKHAFPHGGGGTITVDSRSSQEGHAELAVSDTGPGLPEGFDPATVSSLGFHLITALTEQLGGTLTIEGKPGTTIRIRFPIE